MPLGISALEFASRIEIMAGEVARQARLLVGELKTPAPTPVPAPAPGQADGFDSPVGTEPERAGAQVWPGFWQDANPYANKYQDSSGSSAYHTGADLNLNKPNWDADAHAPVYAAGAGVVRYAGIRGTYWRNVVIVQHDQLPDGTKAFSRYAHLESLDVKLGERVTRGASLGRIGFSGPTGPYHLHFDISLTEVLLKDPGDWPQLDLARLKLDYVDPAVFIRTHRPSR